MTIIPVNIDDETLGTLSAQARERDISLLELIKETLRTSACAVEPQAEDQQSSLALRIRNIEGLGGIFRIRNIGKSSERRKPR